jgi:hypothetical protein
MIVILANQDWFMVPRKNSGSRSPGHDWPLVGTQAGQITGIFQAEKEYRVYLGRFQSLLSLLHPFGSHPGKVDTFFPIYPQQTKTCVLHLFLLYFYYFYTAEKLLLLAGKGRPLHNACPRLKS